MENALDIINDVMDKHRFRHKRDVAEYFGVTPQALSIWIAKNQIPPKHLLKLSQENKTEVPVSISRSDMLEKASSPEELQSVINYLMRENISLKDELRGLKEKTKNLVNCFGSILLGWSTSIVIILLCFYGKQSIVNSPVANFEVTQQGSVGMFIKYHMAVFLAIFGITMLIQFISYFFESIADYKNEKGKRIIETSTSH